MTKYASMQVCKYASMQVCKYACICKYASMQVYKYTSLHIFCKYSSMEVYVCKYASMHGYASMQVYTYMQVCKYGKRCICPQLRYFLHTPRVQEVTFRLLLYLYIYIIYNITCYFSCVSLVQTYCYELYHI